MELVAEAPFEPDETTAIYVRRYELVEGDRFGAHAHSAPQLSWTPHGVLEADVDQRHWALPPTLALWIPGHVEHDVGCSRPAQLHNLYVNPDRCPVDWTQVTTVAVSPLLRELMLHMVESPVPDAARRRAESLVFELLQPVGEVAVVMPMPGDARADAIARGLLTEPADDRTLDEWGALVGASRRTLARLFVAETGMTYTEWRAQARLPAGIVALAEGANTNSAARRAGYRSVSAFAAAFQRNMGQTPGDYVRRLAS